jgi:hypothetical protein
MTSAPVPCVMNYSRRPRRPVRRQRETGNLPGICQLQRLPPKISAKSKDFLQILRRPYAMSLRHNFLSAIMQNEKVFQGNFMQNHTFFF